MFCVTGWLVGKCLVGIDKAVNRMHYLCSAVSTSLSPVAGEKEGRSYLRRADNLQRPHRAETLPVLLVDSTFAPSCTPSHRSLFQCGSAQKYSS